MLGTRGVLRNDLERGRQLRLTAGVSLLAVWAVVILLGVRSGYQVVSLTDLEHDAAAGVVTDWRQATGTSAGATTTMQTGIRLRVTATGDGAEPSGASTGGLIAYTIDADARGWLDNRVRLVAPPGVSGRQALQPGGDAILLAQWGPRAAEVGDLVANLPQRPGGDSSGVVRPTTLQPRELLAMAVLLGALSLIVAGPAPRRGTRWYWFWMLAIPAGLGAVAFVVRETLGLRAQAAPAPERRRGGWRGFVWGVVIWPLLLSAAAFAVIWRFGLGTVPA